MSCHCQFRWSRALCAYDFTWYSFGVQSYYSAVDGARMTRCFLSIFPSHLTFSASLMILWMMRYCATDRWIDRRSRRGKGSSIIVFDGPAMERVGSRTDPHVVVPSSGRTRVTRQEIIGVVFYGLWPEWGWLWGECERYSANGIWLGMDKTQCCCYCRSIWGSYGYHNCNNFE